MIVAMNPLITLLIRTLPDHGAEDEAAAQAAFQDALRQVLDAADAAGLATGILAPDAAAARRYADQGLRFIGIGSDATLLTLAGKHAVDSVHDTPRA